MQALPPQAQRNGTEPVVQIFMRSPSRRCMCRAKESRAVAVAVLSPTPEYFQGWMQRKSLTINITTNGAHATVASLVRPVDLRLSVAIYKHAACVNIIWIINHVVYIAQPTQE
jgi:hypothetical protein